MWYCWISAFCFLVSVSRVTSLQLPQPGAAINITDADLMCSAGKCGLYSYSELQAMYRGLFYTAREIRAMERAMNTKSVISESTIDLTDTSTVSPDQFSDDGALCCSSRFNHYSNTTMTNIQGETKSIIHLIDNDTPSYQFIPHAICVKKGDCEGRCVLEAKLMSILVLEGTQGFTFDIFEIPGYCSCKNIY